jgi:uncharacterized protein
MTGEQKSAFILGAFVFLGLAVFGWLVGSSAIRFKEYERLVSVKGLSEREVPADVAVWPIRFAAASDDLGGLYNSMESNTKEILTFLQAEGFSQAEVTTAAPIVTDKYAERYGDQRVNLRYTAQQTITVYSENIDLVRESQGQMAELGKKGIALGGDEYTQRTTYLFTKLNDIKPAMIEEATQNARAVAEQFAADSKSKLGKIRRANQGQFTIEDRDSNTPYLKKVRVVSTVDYYLSD